MCGGGSSNGCSVLQVVLLMLRVDGPLLCVLLVLERRMHCKQQRIAISTLCTLLLKFTEVYLLGICVWSCLLKCAKP